MLSSANIFDDTITDDVQSAAVNVEMYQPKISNPEMLFLGATSQTDPVELITLTTPHKTSFGRERMGAKEMPPITTPRMSKSVVTNHTEVKASVSDLFESLWDMTEQDDANQLGSLKFIHDWLDIVHNDLKHSVRQYLSIRDHSWDPNQQSLVRHVCSILVSTLVHPKFPNTRRLARLLLYLSSDDEFSYFFSQSPELVSFLQSSTVLQSTESTELFDLLAHLIRNYPISFQESVKISELDEIKTQLMREDAPLHSDLMELFAIYVSYPGIVTRLHELTGLPQFYKMLVSNLSNDDAKLLANSLCILVHSVQDPNVRAELFSEANVFKICHLVFSTLGKSSSWAKHTTMCGLLSALTEDKLIRGYLFKFLSMYFDEQIQRCITHLWNQPAIPIAGQILHCLTDLAIEYPESDLCQNLFHLLKANVIEDGATTCLANVIETCQFIHRDYEACRSIFEDAIKLVENIMTRTARQNMAHIDALLESLFKAWIFVYETLERTLAQQKYSQNPVLDLEPIVKEVERLVVCTMKLSALGFRRRVENAFASSNASTSISFLISEWLISKTSTTNDSFDSLCTIKERIALMVLAMQSVLRQQTILGAHSNGDSLLQKVDTMVETGLSSTDVSWQYTCYRLKADLIYLLPLSHSGSQVTMTSEGKQKVKPEEQIRMISFHDQRMDDTTPTVRGLEALKQQLQETVQDFQKALQLQGSMSQQQTCILETKVASLEEMKLMNQRALQQVESRLVERDASLKLAKEQVTVLNATIGSLREELNLSEQRKTSLEDTLRQLRTKVEMLQATHEQQLQDLTDRHDRQEQEFLAQKSEMEDHIEKLLSAKKSLEIQCQAQQEHIQDLEQEVQGQEEEYDQLLSKLAQNFQTRKQKKKTKTAILTNEEVEYMQQEMQNTILN